MSSAARGRPQNESLSVRDGAGTSGLNDKSSRPADRFAGHCHAIDNLEFRTQRLWRRCAGDITALRAVKLDVGIVALEATPSGQHVGSVATRRDRTVGELD